MQHANQQQHHPAPIVLEVTVKNHPGVMSHISGLFARRFFNLEGIHCMPIKGTQLSRMYLVVNEDQRIAQVIQQVSKLEDVIEVNYRDDGPQLLQRLDDISV